MATERRLSLVKYILNTTLQLFSAFSAGRSSTDDLRTLESALYRKGISKEFDEWFAIAKDRPKWRQQTYSNPKPPDA